MSDKLKAALTHAKEDKAREVRRAASAEAQSADLWRKLKSEVEAGAKQINQDDESRRLAGGRLEYKPIDSKGYLSESEFEVKNETLPGRRVTVRNCGKYLSVEIVSRRLVRQDTEEEDISNEDLHFDIDEGGYVFLKAKGGRKLYDAEEAAVYLFEKFWN